MNFTKYSLGLTSLLISSSPALAYIGPGAGVSFLGSFLSVLGVILLTIGVILFWPVRYLWRRLRRPATPLAEAESKPDLKNRQQQN